MSQELTPEQRLTQMEKLLESAIKLSRKNAAQIEANSQAIDRLTAKTEANSQAIDRLTVKTEANSQAIDRLTVKMAEATDLFLDSMKVIKEMQKEVRGLQVENRRILDRVFGEDTTE